MFAGGSSTVTYSDIEGGFDGEGNIDADPLFVDASAGDYHLKDNNPCFGVGIPENTLKTDIEGSSRPNPIGSNPDMGAYESNRAKRLLYTAPIMDGLDSTDISFWNE